MELALEQDKCPASNLPKLIDQSVKDISMHITRILCYICEVYIRSKYLENKKSSYLSIEKIKRHVNFPVGTYDHYIEQFITPILKSKLLIQKNNETYRKFLVTNDLENILIANQKLTIIFAMENDNHFRISYFRLLQIYIDRKARLYNKETQLLALFITVISRTPVVFKLTIEPPEPKLFHDNTVLTSISDFDSSLLGRSYTNITQNLGISYNHLSPDVHSSKVLQHLNINAIQQNQSFLILADGIENIPPQNQSRDNTHAKDLNLCSFNSYSSPATPKELPHNNSLNLPSKQNKTLTPVIEITETSNPFICYEDITYLSS